MTDDYDSDKDPMYAPDLEHDMKSQKKSRVVEVLAKIAARRIERPNGHEDFDAIEVMAEDSFENDENVEYDIHLTNSDDTVQKKKVKKKDFK